MKRIAVAYLVAVHVLLVTAIAKTDLVPRVAARLNLTKPQMPGEMPEEDSIIPTLRTIHKQMDSSVPAGVTIFLGDSITMALATAALAPRTVNYGIGSQRSDQLLKSMDLYKSIERASRVVIMIGTNDLLQGREEGIESRYRAILEKIPGDTQIIMNSVPPLDNPMFYGHQVEDASVRKVVASAKAACGNDPRCRFVNTYDALTSNSLPAPGVLLADKIHLAREGYRLWIEAMQLQINL